MSGERTYEAAAALKALKAGVDGARCDLRTCRLILCAQSESINVPYDEWKVRIDSAVESMCDGKRYYDATTAAYSEKYQELLAQLQVQLS